MKANFKRGLNRLFVAFAVAWYAMALLVLWPQWKPALAVQVPRNTVIEGWVKFSRGWVDVPNTNGGSTVPFVPPPLESREGPAQPITPPADLVDIPAGPPAESHTGPAERALNVFVGIPGPAGGGVGFEFPATLSDGAIVKALEKKLAESDPPAIHWAGYERDGQYWCLMQNSASGSVPCYHDSAWFHGPHSFIPDDPPPKPIATTVFFGSVPPAIYGLGLVAAWVLGGFLADTEKHHDHAGP